MHVPKQEKRDEEKLRSVVLKHVSKCVMSREYDQCVCQEIK